MAHKKKDEGDDSTTTSNGNEVVVEEHNNKPTTPTGSPRRRRSSSSSSVLVNTGLSITLFFALVQFFDPSVRQHHVEDMAHHNLNHDPVRASLAAFSNGKDGLRSSSAQASSSSRSEASVGRERILELLEEAGIAKDLSNSQIDRLPKWQQVSRDPVCAMYYGQAAESRRSTTTHVIFMRFYAADDSRILCASLRTCAHGLAVYRL
jgi:hypothetical protein